MTTETKHPDRLGNCYADAFERFEDVLAVHRDAQLAHGIVVGVGAATRGVRFDHAWIETPSIVFDGVVPCPRSMYYKIGTINPSTVIRYPYWIAIELASTIGTYGPWDHDLLQQTYDKATDVAHEIAAIGSPKDRLAASAVVGRYREALLRSKRAAALGLWKTIPTRRIDDRAVDFIVRQTIRDESGK